MFHAIFFDMDGVTIDSEPQWQESERELMSEFGYVWTEADEVACLGGPLSRVGLYMAEKVASDLGGTWFMEALIAKQMDKLRMGARILPGVLELIAEFRKLELPVALVSASPRNIMNAALEGLPGDLFDFTISSDDVARTKPFPDPYLHAAKRAGVEISHCLVIEDSLTGITSAEEAGAHILAVPHFIDVAPSKRVAVAKTLAGLTPEKIYSFFS